MSNRVRTKGNVKPSNSERASRLLASNQLVSFSQASKTLSSVYGATNQKNESVSAFDCDMSSDFQNIFKHMGKKDINTKIKALEDFIVLCETKDQQELIKIIRYWFRIYRKLSNAIEFNIRHLAHEAFYHFISKFDRDMIVQHIESFGNNETTCITNEISFQNLITMSAVIWTSCFDDYPQPRMAAIRNFEYLFRDSTDKSKNLAIDFLLNNYESILNYCLYVIFKKIPIDLFYTTVLPSDSVKMFEDHSLIISLAGLTSMIQDLNQFKSLNSIEDSKKKNIINCFEKIFLRVNLEFIKCKGLDGFDTSSLSIKQQEQQPEKEIQDNGEELEMSKKEKKKFKKKMMESSNQQQLQSNQSNKKKCDYWKCLTSPNINVRVAFYHNLSTITRLTTFFSKDPFEVNGNGLTYFEKLNIANRLWYKLYKKNFFECIFNGFVDDAPEIKGLSWLIGSHLLSNVQIYDPWSVINCDEWLNKTLKPFIINGMRTVGTAIDFGLKSIHPNLQNCAQHQEFYAANYEHLSAWKILLPKFYEELEIYSKIRLIITFIESFDQSKSSSNDYKIYKFFLENLHIAFGNVFLCNDSYFLVELYFNICLLAMKKCLKASSKSSQVEEEIKKMIISIVEQIYQLLEKTLFEEKSAILWKSQVNLNHLLFLHKTKEYYLVLCESKTKYNPECLLNYYKHFESVLLFAYQKFLTNFMVHQIGILRFLTESFFNADHYFSPDYFLVNINNVDYAKNMLKILQKSIAIALEKEMEEKQKFSKLETFDKIMPPHKTVYSNKTVVSLVNLKYDIDSERSFIKLSLFDIMPSFVECTISTINDLIKFIDSMFKKENDLQENFDESYQKILLLLFHLQYILKPLCQEQITPFTKNLQENLLNWIQKIQNFCVEFIDDTDQNDRRNSLRKYLHFVHLGQKIFDIFLVLTSKLKISLSEILRPFLSKLNPLAFKLVFEEISILKSMPLSSMYSEKVVEFEKLINQYIVLDYEEYFPKIGHQIQKLFDKSYQTKTLEFRIVNEFYSLISDVDYEDDHNGSKIKFICDLVEIVCDNLKKLNNEEILNSAIHSEYPILMWNFHSDILANYSYTFNRIDIFEHIKLILEKITFLLTCDHFNENARFFCKNAYHYWLKPTYYYLLFKKIDNSEEIFQKTIELNFDFIIDRIIFNEKNLINTNDAIQFIDCTIGIIASSDFKPNSKLLHHITKQLMHKLVEKSSIFKENYDFSHLINLYYEQENSLLQIYQILHLQRNEIFKQNIDYRKIFKMEWKTMDEGFQFLQMNLLFVQTIHTLMNDFYCLKNDAKQDLLKITKQLYQNHYLLEYFQKIFPQLNPKKLYKLKKTSDETVDIFELRSIERKFKEFSKMFEKLLFSMMKNFSLISLNQTNDKTKTNHSLLYYSMLKFPKEFNLNLINSSEIEFHSEIKFFELFNSTNFDANSEFIKSITIEANDETASIKCTDSCKALLIFLIHCNIKYEITTNYDDIKPIWITILKELANGDLIHLLINNDIDYPMFAMLILFLKNSTKFIDDFDSRIFLMFIEFYKNLIQKIFTEGYDIEFNRLILFTKIIDSLCSFIKSIQNSNIFIEKNNTDTDNQDGENDPTDRKHEIMENLRNFFAYHSLNLLLPLFINISDHFEKEILYNEYGRQLSNVLRIGVNMECLNDIAMFELNQSLLIPSDQSELKVQLQSLLNVYESSNPMNCLQTENNYYKFVMDYCTPLLLSNEFCIVICAYHLISITIRSADWKTNEKNNIVASSSPSSPDQNNELTISELNSSSNMVGKQCCYPPEILDCLMKNIHRIFEEEPFQSMVFKETYLLVYSLFFRLLARYPYNEADNERRLDLINYLMETNLHEELFNYLFIYLEPNNHDLDKEKFLEDVIESFLDGQSSKMIIAKLDRWENSSSTIDEIFPIKYNYYYDEPDSRYLALFVYYQALCYIPNAVRCWFNKLKHTEKTMVDKITKKYFTRLLIEKEIESITKADREKLGKIQLKFSKQSNEIIASYSFKEISFGIKFLFKDNYPLTPVAIDCFNKSGVSEDVCRKWLHRLTIFFNKLNCPILDGIIMIKPNMDKFFEGIEECMICLFVLYGVNGQLPRFKCPQCKKKFHTICVRKWFQTSNVASCPQCKFEFQ